MKKDRKMMRLLIRFVKWRITIIVLVHCLNMVALQHLYMSNTVSHFIGSKRGKARPYIDIIAISLISIMSRNF